MLERETPLEIFKHENFFEATDDYDPEEEIPYVLLEPRGMQLIDDYYADKYEIPHFKKFPSFEKLADYISSPEFKETIKSIDNIRLTFVVSSNIVTSRGPSTHSTPVVFVKENGKQGMAAFDSIALSPKFLADNISKKIPVLTVKDWDEARPEKNFSSQRDSYSCHSGAMVYFKNMTGKINGNYIMPNLLDTLMENAQLIERNLYAASLPGKLLITAQDKKFFSLQNANLQAIVHKHHNKDETLAEFLSRYPEAADFGKESKQHVSSYVRSKGLKYTNIIEMQFYINQFKQHFGNDFTPDLREKFIQQAKQLFKEQGELTSENINSRPGIHQLAENFFSNLVRLKMEGESKVSTQEIEQPLRESDYNSNPVAPLLQVTPSIVLTQVDNINSDTDNSTRFISELNECLQTKNWTSAIQILLAMTPDKLKDPKIDKMIQQSSVQDEIRKEYQHFLDEIKRVDRNQRSAIIKNVLEKKNALGAILCPGKESPFFGAREIKQQPIKIVKVGPSVQKKY